MIGFKSRFQCIKYIQKVVDAIIFIRFLYFIFIVVKYKNKRIEIVNTVMLYGFISVKALCIYVGIIVSLASIIMIMTFSKYKRRHDSISVFFISFLFDVKLD